MARQFYCFGPSVPELRSTGQIGDVKGASEKPEYYRNQCGLSEAVCAEDQRQTLPYIDV